MEEYVYLFSNFNAMKYYGKPNKIGNFKNQLACNIPLNENWKVALSEIIFTKSWYNVRDRYNIGLVDELGTFLKFNEEFSLTPGHYDTPDMLINEINMVLKKFPINKTPLIRYSPRENFVYVNAGKTDNLSVFPDLGEEIENILGLRNRNSYIYEYNYAMKDETKYVFKNLDVFETDSLKGFHPVEINAGINYLCVYCDIVAESFTGDTKSQLLSLVEIPRKSKFGETIHIRYNTKNYKNIYTDKFQNIEISIRDSSNRIIPFMSGQCTCVLHFINNTI